jgi:hypothetical protein
MTSLLHSVSPTPTPTTATLPFYSADVRPHPLLHLFPLFTLLPRFLILPRDPLLLAHNFFAPTSPYSRRLSQADRFTTPELHPRAPRL